VTWEEFCHAMLKLYFDQFSYDIAVMGQGWMYYLLFIPIICYLIFFLAKWVFLLMPIWLPMLVLAEFLETLIKRLLPKWK
jgi:hypothetical protein